jgi:hypothetical protein
MQHYGEFGRGFKEGIEFVRYLDNFGLSYEDCVKIWSEVTYNPPGVISNWEPVMAVHYYDAACQVVKETIPRPYNHFYEKWCGAKKRGPAFYDSLDQENQSVLYRWYQRKIDALEK